MFCKEGGIAIMQVAIRMDEGVEGYSVVLIVCGCVSELVGRMMTKSGSS